MAKAKVVVKERKPKSASFVRLRLTFEEAETLRFVCASIGGTMETPRKDMEAISLALDNIGVESGNHHVDRRNRTIYFLESTGYSFADVFERV